MTGEHFVSDMNGRASLLLEALETYDIVQEAFESCDIKHFVRKRRELINQLNDLESAGGLFFMKDKKPYSIWEFRNILDDKYNIDDFANECQCMRRKKK